MTKDNLVQATAETTLAPNGQLISGKVLNVKSEDGLVIIDVDGINFLALHHETAKELGCALIANAMTIAQAEAKGK